MAVKISCGRGGWSWYTGSSSWYYRCGIEYLLGIVIKDNILTVKPCIPDEWEEYFVRYKHRSSVYNIKVINRFKTNTVNIIKINGSKQEEKQIRLIDNNKIYDVEIEI